MGAKGTEKKSYNLHQIILITLKHRNCHKYAQVVLTEIEHKNTFKNIGGKSHEKMQR